MRHFFILLLSLLSFSVFSQTSFIGESVEYDPIGNRFFTSANSTSIIQRAANGDLSYFGDGAESDYGMEVMNGRLYTTSGGRIYEYDLTTEEELSNILIPGAGFLNGMSSDAATERIWVTDFSNNRIHLIDYSSGSPVTSVQVANTQVTPNGVWHDAVNDRLLFVTWGSNASIRSVDLAAGSAPSTEIQLNVGNVDGIDEDNQGNLYVSAWSPNRIIRVSPDLSSLETVTVSGLNSSADICYAKEIDTLAIPSTSQETIFIGFDVVDDLFEAEDPLGLDLFPNPSQGATALTFDLASGEEVRIQILDLSGRVINDHGAVAYPQGKNTALIPTTQLRAGQYVVRAEIRGVTAIERMVVID